MSKNKPKIISVTSLPPRVVIKLAPSEEQQEQKIEESPTKTLSDSKKYKIQRDSDLIPLHKGCRIKVSKTELLEIYTEHPALYTIRLAGIVFGKETLSAVSKESESNAIDLLDQNVLNSLISKCAFLIVYYIRL